MYTVSSLSERTLLWPFISIIYLDGFSQVCVHICCLNSDVMNRQVMNICIQLIIHCKLNRIRFQTHFTLFFTTVSVGFGPLLLLLH